MSLFDEDLVERELGYDPDPHENMIFQIKKEFNILCDTHDETSDILTFLNILKNGMSLFMEYLHYNILPDWWKGDFLNIIGYGVTVIHLTNGWSGIQVSWNYTNSFEYQSIDLRIDTTGFINKHKNIYGGSNT